MSSNTYDNFHEYEIQWTPDTITWLIDGKVGRTKKRSDTWNATSNQWSYPQTPARVQLSIWPGGLASNAQGTINWAGGQIDWNSDEIKNYGYYFATFAEVTVQCYKTTSPPGTNKGTSYYYNDASATNNTVVDSNKPTVLKSFLATGLDMNKGDGTTSGAAASASSSSSVNAIPGGGSTPPNQVPGSGSSSGGSGSGSGGGSGGSGSDSGSGGSGSSSAPGCVTSGFSQTCGGSGSNGGKSNDGVRGTGRTLGASAFAVVVGFAGLLLL